MVALEDELVVWKGRGGEDAGVDDARDEGVEVAADGRDSQEIPGLEGREEGGKDLETHGLASYSPES